MSFNYEASLQDPWYTRGYLRHFDSEGSVQFVTFGLSDSVPQSVLDKWRQELESDEIADIDFRKRVEMYLDQGYGSCCLKDYGVASVVRDTLFKFDKVKYDLIAWVIMPNHAHVLFKLLPGWSYPALCIQ
jgi:hypothetical protein